MRKVSRVAEAAAQHYDEIARLQFDRMDSDILNLRKFNNWVKAMLLSWHTARGRPLLDICCGKMGDLPKHITNEIGFLVAADISGESVKEGIRRFQDSKNALFDAAFLVCNCFQDDVPSLLFSKLAPLKNSLWFATVSCQFSLHYSFVNEATVRGFVRNVCERMANGARFVATVADMRKLLKKLAEVPSDSLRFGNAFFNVEVYDANLKAKSADDAAIDKLIREQVLTNPFGRAYEFTLRGSVEALTEFLVPIPVLRSLFQEHGVRLVETLNFGEFWKKYRSDPEGSEAFERMVLGPSTISEEGVPPSLSTEEWEIAHLYRTLVFQKDRRDPTPGYGSPIEIKSVSATAGGRGHPQFVYITKEESM
eukprot:ANDGO_04284.mRNA.1 mRNA cap guanine-N7 methyltransferase 1